jgi:molybdopterin-guanine dinucleotide biosynthesis protein A
MGRDKAMLELEGVPLWRRQRDVLIGAGATEIFLSARPDQSWARGATGFTAVVHDAMADCGPMVGVTAALERMSQPWLAVLAIDLPQITSAWFSDLLTQSSPGVGIVGRRGGIFEPLAAVYPREIMWLAWEALVRGDYSLQQLVGTATAQGLMRVSEIAPQDAAMFTNWNTEADRA